LLGENLAWPTAIKRPDMSLEAHICAMGPHKPPEYPSFYQKQPKKKYQGDCYISLGYVKQQGVAVQLFLSF